MKALKDIGSTQKVKVLLDADTIVERLEIKYTDDERRELVRDVFIRAYKMGVNKMYEYEHQEMGYPQHEWDFEDWIKSEGL